ncbi:MAG TPA: zinc-dependent metalloprotease [Blastocatellia bacterium]|nr:zinc-dependent metalloprotease [Blastocatellia bacterium]
MRNLIFALLMILLSIPVFAQDRTTQDKPAPVKSIAEKTAGLRKLDGYMPLYWDEAGGKMYLEISRFNTEFLYQVSLAAGVGSNDIGLDRGQLGNTHVVYFERVGPKVLMISPNYRYRAITSNPDELRSVQESFAQSVLWGFKVEAAEADRVLVDATGFFLRDAHGVIDAFRRAKQGTFRLDESRSAFYLARTKVFPLNTEVETTLTFTGDDPGPWLLDTAPDPRAITVREHHSLVQLPDANYKPRRLDARVGVFGIEFEDFGSPFSEPIEKRWIERHRLQKKDPTAPLSEPVTPIVYYVDNGAPEVIRKALIEGASWWNEAFEAAGFKNAFQVKVLPSDADPMDLRYNMISWVDRSTRGWSYGASVTDPRTGEIIKGNVTLGSLRDRQDYLIATGLIPTYHGAPNGASTGASGGASTGSGAGAGNDGEGCDFGALPVVDYLAAADPSADPERMALARVRQLAAHEVGHTLGLAHNFAASTYGRASVMDYPAPMVEIKDGKLDLSNAYPAGIGAYDKFAIKYGYSEFPPGTNESAALEKLVEDGVAAGMLYITDEDARPAGAAHPLASLWDNGSDPVAMLRHEMEVRRIAMSQFGLGNVPTGTPLAMLEAKLVPLYLHHRYQLAAAVKSVGGLYYTYAVKTASGPNPAVAQEIVPAVRQREALAAVLDTIKPEELAIPSRILELIPPRAFGYTGRHTELFATRTDPAFDPIGVATIAADMAVSALLEPHRAARLIDYHARNRDNPGFAEVVHGLIASTWSGPEQADPYHAEIARAVQSLVVTRLMDLAGNPQASHEVRETAEGALDDLAAALALGISKFDSKEKPDQHFVVTLEEIKRFSARPDSTRPQSAPLPPPPGDPIGLRPGYSQPDRRQ